MAISIMNFLYTRYNAKFGPESSKLFIMCKFFSGKIIKVMKKICWSQDIKDSKSCVENFNETYESFLNQVAFNPFTFNELVSVDILFQIYGGELRNIIIIKVLSVFAKISDILKNIFICTVRSTRSVHNCTCFFPHPMEAILTEAFNALKKLFWGVQQRGCCCAWCINLSKTQTPHIHKYLGGCFSR